MSRASSMTSGGTGNSITLKSLLLAFWFYLSWQPTLKWLTIIAACLTLPVLVLLPFVQPTNVPLMSVALLIISVFGLVIPFFASGIAFRRLVSDRQYSLAPESCYTSLLALFLLTLLMCVLPYVTGFMTTGQAYYNLPVIIFILATLYLGMTQLNLPPWTMIFIGWLPIIVINSMRWLPPGLIAFFTSPAVVLTLFTAAVAAWVLAVMRMKTGRPLKPTRNSLRAIYTEYGTFDLNAQAEWLGMIQSRTSASATDSLYYNMMMSMTARIKRVAIPMLFMMLFVVIISSQRGNAERPLTGFLLLITIIGAVISTMSNIELLPRSKMLWMRTGSVRSDIWKLIQTNMLKDWAVLVAMSLMVMIFIGLVGSLPAATLILGIATVACSLPFFSLFPLYWRQIPSGMNTFIMAAGLTIAMGVLLVCSITGVMMGKYTVLLVFDAVILVLGVISGIACKKQFQSVDWLRLKPRCNTMVRRTA